MALISVDVVTIYSKQVSQKLKSTPFLSPSFIKSISLSISSFISASKIYLESMNFSLHISTVTILIQATIISYPDNWYAYLFAYIHNLSPNLSSTQETEYSSKIVKQIMLVSCITELWLSFSWKKLKFPILIIWFLSTFLCYFIDAHFVTVTLNKFLISFLSILSCVDIALLYNLTSALSFLNWCSCFISWI